MSDYKTLNIIAYEHLRNMIYAGELEFNRVYSETKLASQLSISRTPIRDALNRLSQERYIDIIPNRGFTLHIPTREDAAAAYHLRLMTESYCAEIVRRAGTPITEIFQRHGEAYFRDLESAVIRDLSARGGAVIATGNAVI